jgi:hypothetical protein
MRAACPEEMKMPKPKKVLAPGQERKIAEQYAQGGPENGLLAIARKFGHSVGVIRRVLTDAGVSIRTRGRPRSIVSE